MTDCQYVQSSYQATDNAGSPVAVTSAKCISTTSVAPAVANTVYNYITAGPCPAPVAVSAAGASETATATATELNTAVSSTDNVNTAVASNVATSTSTSPCASLTGLVVVVLAISPAAADANNQLKFSVVVRVYSSSGATVVSTTDLTNVCGCLQSTISGLLSLPTTDSFWHSCDITPSAQKRYFLQTSGNSTVYVVNMTTNPITNGTNTTAASTTASGTTASGTTASGTTAASTTASGTTGTSTPGTTPTGSNSGSVIVPGFVAVFVSLIVGSLALFKNQ